MSNQLKRADDVAAYCPSCLTCVDGDPDECPECGGERGSYGWKPLELSPQAYLGYLLDGRYLLDQYIGGGASGEVYRAIDRKLDRPFALKLVEFSRNKSDETREEERRRFRNEVEAMSRLRNPHVIDIYEWFRLSDHTSGLLTEYIDGRTLREMLDAEGKLAFDRAVGIIRQVANGLHEAHEEGVIHRDLKPDNVMVEELPASGFFARILDFGLVRLVEDASRTQGFRGTPLYAAPEQCQAGMSVDRRADIYALGCVMFHALSGRPPFMGDDAIEVMESHTGEEPPTLSESSSDAEIPRRLDELMDEMLEKDPADRPDSLRRVIEVLDEVSRIEAESGDEPSEVTYTSTAEVAPLGEQSTIASEDEPSFAESDDEEGDEIWSTQTGGLPAEFLQAADLGMMLDDYTPGAATVRLQKRGSCIVLADGDNRVHLVARGSYEYEDSFGGARMRLTALASPLARGGVFGAEMNGRVLRWGVDLRSGEPEAVVDFPSRVLAMDVDAGETVLVVGTEDGEVLRYDLRTESVTDRTQLTGAVSELRVGEDGREVVAATLNGTLHRIGFGDEIVAETVFDDLEEPGALAVGPRGVWHAILDRAGELRFVHRSDPERSFAISPVPGELRSIHFSRNGQLLGVTLADSNLCIWAFHHDSVLARDLTRE